MPQLNHHFYQKSKTEKRWYFLKVISILALTLSVIGLLGFLTKSFLFFLPAIWCMQIAAPFIDTPMGVANGSLLYYSPLLIVQKSKSGNQILHGGTLFDYFYVLRKFPPHHRRDIIVYSYLDGLINLLKSEKIDGGKTQLLSGTSYIINQRTVTKLGFKTIKTDSAQQMVLYLNYIQLVISQSFALGKLSFPNYARIITFEGKLEDLSTKEPFLNALKSRLQEKIERKTTA